MYSTAVLDLSLWYNWVFFLVVLFVFVFLQSLTKILSLTKLYSGSFELFSNEALTFGLPCLSPHCPILPRILSPFNKRPPPLISDQPQSLIKFLIFHHHPGFWSAWLPSARILGGSVYQNLLLLLMFPLSNFLSTDLSLILHHKSPLFLVVFGVKSVFFSHCGTPLQWSLSPQIKSALNFSEVSRISFFPLTSLRMDWNLKLPHHFLNYREPDLFTPVWFSFLETGD